MTFRRLFYPAVKKTATQNLSFKSVFFTTPTRQFSSVLHPPHTPHYLELQIQALSKLSKNRGDKFTLSLLSQGKEVIGLTGTQDIIMSGVPVYELDHLQELKTSEESRDTIQKLGCQLAKYELSNDIECVTQIKADKKIYYIHDDFMFIKEYYKCDEKNIPAIEQDDSLTFRKT